MGTAAVSGISREVTIRPPVLRDHQSFRVQAGYAAPLLAASIILQVPSATLKRLQGETIGESTPLK